MTRRSALAAAMVAVAAMAGCSLPGQITGPVELTAVFDDVGDLVTGHSVQVADVRVGSITGIELTDDYRAKRSEEHTSELQSLMRISYAVFCLKKKNKSSIEK